MSGDNQAMITLTRFDLPSFQYLANLFAPIYEQDTPYLDVNGYIVRKFSMTRGRPRMGVGLEQNKGIADGSPVIIWDDHVTSVEVSSVCKKDISEDPQGQYPR